MRFSYKKIAQLLFLLCCMFAAVTGYSADFSITASVDQTVLNLSQEFTLTIEYSGSGANSASEPELPDLNPYASYIGSAGSSSNFQFVNGRMSVTKSFSFRYLTAKEGEFEIPPIQVKHKGETYETDPVTIQIVKSAYSPQPQQKTSTPKQQAGADENIEGNLFLRAIVDKTKAYPNEPIHVTYRIYTRVEVTNYGITKLPNTAGFWTEEFPMPQRPVQRKEIINGKEFVVADIKRITLFATGSGTKTIDPLGIECEVRQSRQRNSRSLFDRMFDDPFFGRMVRKSIYSQPITIEVAQFPEEGKQADFSGAVGSYTLKASVDKKDVETNEAITLTVSISGTGNIKMLPAPNVDIPTDLEQYKPKVTENINRSGANISGNKMFEYVLVPRLPGEHRIKPIKYNYFDLNSKTYRTLTSPEIVITARKGSREYVSLGPGLSKEDVKLVGRDIQFIKRVDLTLARKGVFLYKSVIFWILLVFPLCALVGALFYRRHLDHLATNIAYARQRQANRNAIKRLQNAKKKMSEQTQKEFYAEIAKALVGYIADKLNLAAAGLVTDDIEKQLRSRSIPEEKIRSFLDCLNTCDYQRFAPSDATLQKMQEFYAKARTAMVELDEN